MPQHTTPHPAFVALEQELAGLAAVIDALERSAAATDREIAALRRTALGAA